MKGQFFVISTVIMIYALMTMIQYVYDFSDINLVQLKKMTELDSIQYIKDALNQTVLSSNSSLDCNKVDIDLKSTEGFLEREMISRGISLVISHTILSCPPNIKVDFHFTIKSSNIYIESPPSPIPMPPCPDGLCNAGENCPADAPSCSEPAICHLKACNNGCNNPPTTVPSGLQDNEGVLVCNNAFGCSSPPCECDGSGNCVAISSPPPIPGGLNGDYYNNMDFTNYVLTRTDSTINFDWSTGSPDASIGADTFSVRWQGYVKADYSETYTFYLTSDDGSKLWIDNNLVIDSWVDQWVGEYPNTGLIALTAGWHTIKYEYYENTGDAVAELSYSSPSTTKQIIPTDHLGIGGAAQCTPANDIIKQVDYPSGSCLSSSAFKWSHDTCGGTKVCNQDFCKLVNSTMTSYTLPSGKYAKSDTLSIPYTIKNVGDTPWCFLTQAGITKADSTNAWPTNFNSVAVGSSASDSISQAISCSDQLGSWSGSLYSTTDYYANGGWNVWGTPTFSIQVVECLNDQDCINCKGPGYTCNLASNSCNSAAAPIFSDGFESGDFISGGWSTTFGGGGSASTVQSTTKRTGTYAAKGTISSAAGAYSIAVKNLVTVYPTLYHRSYILFNATPASGAYLLTGPDIMNSAEYDVSSAWIHNAAGTLKWSLKYWDNAGMHLVDDATGTSVATNTWYSVEVMGTTGTGTGAFRMWVNGVKVIEVTGLTNTNYPLSKLQVGPFSGEGGVAISLYTDDAVASTSYIGP